MTSLNINANVGVRGRYRLHVMKDGRTLRETPWFDNLLTNLGMNQMGNSSGWCRYGQVGSSSTTPVFTDTQLGSRIAGSDSGAFSFERFRIESGLRYAVHTKVFTFLNGAAAGNIAEVGVSNNLLGTQLSSRALVLDSGGTPTTITVLADEDLVVVWEFWVKQPAVDFSSAASGKTINIRAAMVDATSGDGAWNGAGGSPFFFLSASYSNRAYTGSIGALTSRPSGTSYLATSVVNNSYVADSYTRTGRLTWDTTTANAAIKSFAWIHGISSWQCELDSALPVKTNTQTLRLDVSVTWSRDSGPA